MCSYGYVGGGYGANSTTPLVASISQNGISFAYTYDSRGNITSETRTDASGNSLTTTYVYDALGQLVRVNDPHENATWVYEYDRGGNMTKRKKYAYTTGSLDGLSYSLRSYTYDSNWKDLLVSNGSYPLTYDAMGNLKTYADWEYEWEAGRQLVKQTQNEKVVSYKYDHNGMRVSKTFAHTNGTVYAVTNYAYYGTKLVHMTRNSDTLHFFYDNQGRPAKVSYNGEMYTYLHNLQGDIVGIVDSNGNLVVEYKYNAWGTILTKSGSMVDTLGNLNPFRYRGYVYDEESGLYYLRSRYYYPELHRFINADTLLGHMGALNSHNLFAYCGNMPIGNQDPDGRDWILAPEAYGPALGVTTVALVMPAWLKRLKEAVSSVDKYISQIFSSSYESKRSFSSTRSIEEEIGNIARKHKNQECVQAAKAVSKYLKKQKKKHNLITLDFETAYHGLVVSDANPNQAITESGKHFGIEYDGNVYCNIYPSGRPYEVWVGSFSAVDAITMMPIMPTVSITPLY